MFYKGSHAYELVRKTQLLKHARKQCWEGYKYDETTIRKGSDAINVEQSK